MTPLRSQRSPPSAARMSGVAKRSIAATSADQTNTASRLDSFVCVAATAPTPASTPITIAIQPSRFSPSRTTNTPAATAAAASTREGTGVRSMIGGSAMKAASTPRAKAPQASSRAPTRLGTAASASALTGPAPEVVRRRSGRPRWRAGDRICRCRAR